MLPKASGLQSMVRRVLVPSFLATFALLPANATELAAVGAVQAFDCKGARVEVLGIKVQGDIRTAKAICGLKADGSLSYVALTADVDAAGIVRLTTLSTISQTYVPGASLVYLRGQVSDVNFSSGLISISGASVLATFDLPSKSTLVEVVGIQPIVGGIVLPSELVAQPSSSIGTGINSSIGTGINRSIGTGINSSIGTGINSSIGTGINSSIGTGINSSIGTGINSSIGTGINSSIGTGINSSIGTGINSSIGTGVNSSIGTGINSSIGTGVNSSIGTGRNSSIGTG